MKRIGLVDLASKILLFIAFTGLFLLPACSGGGKSNIPEETSNSGTIHISADESFKPVIDSQIKVFESQNPDAKIIVQYKPEAEALRDLNVDSIRMVIVTRGLSEAEQKTLHDKLSFTPQFEPVAYDAIAVIVNNQVKDSIFSMQDIRSIAKGTSGYPYKMLLDGTTATSTVRFVVDSLLQGQPLSKNIVAASSSEGVIDYVSKNKDAVGLVGVSWIGNKEDSNQLNFLQKVNIAAIECRGCKDGPFVKPYQANIYYNRYPMIRTIYYILKENYNGLGSGFRNFLIYEKGQRIFKRAYLLPAKMRLEVQSTEISQ